MTIQIKVTDSTGATGTFTLPATISDATIAPPPPSHPAPAFTATPTSITAGQPVVLSWNCPQASGIYLGSTGVTGPAKSQTFYPQVTSTYNLKVEYPGEPDVTLLVSVTVTQPPVPPPVVAGKIKLGVNAIFNGQDARNAANLGAPYIAVTFNDGLAVALRNEYPNLMVSHRALLYGGGLPNNFAEKHGYALTAGMIVLGLNENDQIGDQPKDIADRAQFDATWYKRCQDIGAQYVGGGFSMGVPDILQADIRSAMRDHYAPLVADGMWFNQHTYSGNDGSGIALRDRLWVDKPNTVTLDGHTATMQQWDWLETRWHCYYWFCGFDPKGKGRIISDETGWDDRGGFMDNKATDQEVTRWAARYIELASAPFMVDGVLYPSPMVAAAVFQSGDDDKWAGYEFRLKFQAMHDAGVWA